MASPSLPKVNLIIFQATLKLSYLCFASFQCHLLIRRKADIWHCNFTDIVLSDLDSMPLMTFPPLLNTLDWFSLRNNGRVLKLCPLIRHHFDVPKSEMHLPWDVCAAVSGAQWGSGVKNTEAVRVQREAESPCGDTSFVTCYRMQL